MSTPINNKIKRLLLIVGVCFIHLPAIADALPSASLSPSLPTPETSDILQSDSSSETRESIFPNASHSLAESHFTWGAEVGSSIDISGYDTSTFNVDALIGYKNSLLKIVGIGVGIHRSFGTGDNYVPIYAVLRTSFTKRPRLFFFSLKAGYSFNTIGDAPTFGDVNASAGIGINLAMSRHFHTHIILSYEFRHFNKRHRSAIDLDADDISLASLTFGINF